MEFKVLEKNHQDFFQLLPNDWRSHLAPIWQKYAKEKSVFVIMQKGKIVVGGIVASGIPADMYRFKNELLPFSGSSWRYIGYLWVVPAMRNKKMGTLWLSGVKNAFPKHNLWLSIEEAGLANFYKSHGFIPVKKLDGQGDAEWIFEYRPR